MSESKNDKPIDADFVRKQAEKVTDLQIQRVGEHSDEIEKKVSRRGPLAEFVDEVLLALSFVRAYISGEYRKTPYWVIGAVVFMFLYLLNPFDLIPDFIPVLGQIDDILVVTLCLKLVRQDLHTYEKWKESKKEESELDEV